MSLNNKTALITGGAHRVGKAISLTLAGSGYNLIIHYGRSKDNAEKTAAEIRDMGQEVAIIQADLSEIDSLQHLVKEVEANYASLDVLVNSAASFKKQKLSDISLSDFDLSMAVNLRAPFYLSQQLSKLMLNNQRKSDNGIIVNISDLSGVYPWKDFIQHGVSKAALIHLTKILARELAPTIRVNAITPGPILPPSSMKETDEKWMDMVAKVPLQVSGEPNVIANTIKFFIDNRYVTGAVVPVDGGESLLGSVNH